MSIQFKEVEKEQTRRNQKEIMKTETEKDRLCMKCNKKVFKIKKLAFEKVNMTTIFQTRLSKISIKIA